MYESLVNFEDREDLLIFLFVLVGNAIHEWVWSIADSQGGGNEFVA